MNTESIWFLDADKNYVEIKFDFRDKIYVSGETKNEFGNICNQINPATKAQDELLCLWYSGQIEKKDNEKEIPGILKRISEDNKNVNGFKGLTCENLSQMTYEKQRKWASGMDENGKYMFAYAIAAGSAYMPELPIAWTSDKIKGDGLEYTICGMEFLLDLNDESELCDRAVKKPVDSKYECEESVQTEETKKALEELAKYVVANDGYASVLNGYDGRCIDEDTFMGEVFGCRV